jgi:hypothetical protein
MNKRQKLAVQCVLGSLGAAVSALAACNLDVHTDFHVSTPSFALPGAGGCVGTGPLGFDGGALSLAGGGPTRGTADGSTDFCRPFVNPDLRPSFAATSTASVPPPPISGGTLIAMSDGRTAVAADPDRDALYVVDVAGAAVTYTIGLQPSDEPGRLVEDGKGRVHVALRSGGALVTIDPTKGAIVARRDVCPAPRGVAWDSATDLVWVACATGELVALPAGGGAATVRYVLERDLRDVLIDNGSIAVTKFRSAEVLRLASDGTIARRDALPNDGSFAPHVLWRAVTGPSKKVVTVHQEHSTMPLPTQVVGGYGIGPESSAVTHRCTVVNADGNVEVSVSLDGVLPVDVAVSPDGSSAVVVAAGDGYVPGLASLFLVTLSGNASPAGAPPKSGPSPAFDPDAGGASMSGASGIAGGAVGNGPVLFVDAGPGSFGPIQPRSLPLPFAQTAKRTRSPGALLPVGETPIAVAFDATGRVLVQTREPARLWVIGAQGTASPGVWTATATGTEITLSSVSRDDTGHDVFHASAGTMIACASCHPEGGDDGHKWLLDGEPRRTPSLRGTIAGTAPYHWRGDEADLVVLTDDVYSRRMNGAQLDSSQMNALTGWVQTIPAPPAPRWVDLSAAQRGRALFERSDTQCASCHSGPKFTNNQTIGVGTGMPFQVPPLVGVGWRLPLFHDGCAKSVADRFLTCSTLGHGMISVLSPQDVLDLTAYLETL